jgi:uncharacterized membrane protein YphA (DoxX/SURF4 family)
MFRIEALPISLRTLTVCARLALAASFLAAVTDRLGLWGPHGTTNVAWGDMRHFQEYAAKLNPWFPSRVIPFIGWFVTVAEASLSVGLITGFRIRLVALLSGLLLLAFAMGMIAGTGLKSALNASVVSASACAFLLWRCLPTDAGQGVAADAAASSARPTESEQQPTSPVI